MPSSESCMPIWKSSRSSAERYDGVRVEGVREGVQEAGVELLGLLLVPAPRAQLVAVHELLLGLGELDAWRSGSSTSGSGRGVRSSSSRAASSFGPAALLGVDHELGGLVDACSPAPSRRRARRPPPRRGAWRRLRVSFWSSAQSPLADRVHRRGELAPPALHLGGEEQGALGVDPLEVGARRCSPRSGVVDLAVAHVPAQVLGHQLAEVVTAELDRGAPASAAGAGSGARATQARASEARPARDGIIESGEHISKAASPGRRARRGRRPSARGRPARAGAGGRGTARRRIPACSRWARKRRTGRGGRRSRDDQQPVEERLRARRDGCRRSRSPRRRRRRGAATARLRRGGRSEHDLTVRRVARGPDRRRRRDSRAGRERRRRRAASRRAQRGGLDQRGSRARGVVARASTWAGVWNSTTSAPPRAAQSGPIPWT